MDPQQQTNIQAVARILQQARSAFFVTGAGLSADSGLPTYRGVGGLYDQEITEEGYPIEVVLSGEMFAARPALTWKYLLQVARAADGALPNDGHRVIAEITRQKQRVWTLTQNVDGLLQAGGVENLIEIHGNMRELVCLECHARMSADGVRQLVAPQANDLPRCDCGGLVRPNVVLFGESLPVRAVTRLQEEMQRGFDVVLSIGTSSQFPYIAEPIRMAKRMGTPTVEINPSHTKLSYQVDYHIHLGAAEALRAIWTAANVA